MRVKGLLTGLLFLDLLDVVCRPIHWWRGRGLLVGDLAWLRTRDCIHRSSVVGIIRRIGELLENIFSEVCIESIVRWVWGCNIA